MVTAILQQLGPPIGSRRRTSTACASARMSDMPVPSIQGRLMPGGQQIPLQDLAPSGPFPLDPLAGFAADFPAAGLVHDPRLARLRPTLGIHVAEDNAVLAGL